MLKKEWMSLREGDFIITNSCILRRIINVKSGCITLKKLRKSWTSSKSTVYTPSSCKLFEKVDILYDKELKRFYFTSKILNNMCQEKYGMSIKE